MKTLTTQRPPTPVPTPKLCYIMDGKTKEDASSCGVREILIEPLRLVSGVLLLSLTFATSSAGHITFERAYGGSARDYGISVQQTPDGGYIIAGHTGSFGDDPYLIKTDSLGDTILTGTIDADAKVYSSFSVYPTEDGGYIVGASYWCCPREARILVAKTDSLVNPQWERLYGKSEKRYTWGNWVEQTSDGGYILTAGTGLDPYLVKLDSLGKCQWERTYRVGLENACRCVHQTPDGGYIAAGGRQDIFLMKTDSVGDTVWTKTYGGSKRDEGYWVEMTSDRGYIISGFTESFGAGARDVYLIKTDSLGDTIWTRTYGGKHLEKGYCVQETMDRGYIIAGTTTSFGAGDCDVYLIRVDSIGNPSWMRTYGGSFSDKAFSVRQTSDSGYVITGYTGSCGAGDFDVYLIKTDPEGLVTAEKDLSLASIDSPADTVYADSTYDVEATTHNFSNACLSYDVVVTIGEYSDTVRVEGHSPRSSAQVTFKNWRVPPLPATDHIVVVCIQAGDDVDPTNDCGQKPIFVYGRAGNN